MASARGEQNHCFEAEACGFIPPNRHEPCSDPMSVRCLAGLTSPFVAADMKRWRLRGLYSGRVQGVGFRYTVKTAASGFEVTGLVRNLRDGRVELMAEGLRDELEAFQ